MAKIIKIEEEVVFIGTDDGGLREVVKSDCTFEPEVGVEVEIYSNENKTVVIKKEKSETVSSSAVENEPEEDYSNNPVVYYGISDNMIKSFNKFVEMTGEPKLIVEKDENLSKFEGKLFGKYDIVSLDRALELYPDAVVWVTYAVANNAAKRILKKVEPKRIKFFKANLEYRKGCSFLGHFIDYRVDNFSPCCVSGKSKVKTSGTIPERMGHWERYTAQLIDDIKHGRPNKCDGCRFLKEGFWPKNVELDYICFATNHPGDVCNLRCTYCFVENRFKKLNDKSTEGYTTYEIIRQLSQMPEYNRPNICIELSNGEFCANKHCDDIFDILLNNQWKVRFVSNMTIYNEKFAEFMKTGRTVNILTSLDAGTRETYKAIKRVDCFDKVIENLKRYPVKDVDFKLKYIFLDGVNDNETDVDGFYDIVKDVGCRTIVLSSDSCKPYTDKIKELVVRLIKKAQQDGIMVSKSSYLAPQDDKFIDKVIRGDIS